MLTFSLTGTIGAMPNTAPDELTLAISSVLTRESQPPRVAWVLCVAREPALRAEIIARAREGDHVRIEGEIEQRRRQVGERDFHSVGFVIRSVEHLPTPPNAAAAA